MTQTNESLAEILVSGTWDADDLKNALTHMVCCYQAYTPEAMQTDKVSIQHLFETFDHAINTAHLIAFPQ